MQDLWQNIQKVGELNPAQEERSSRTKGGQASFSSNWCEWRLRYQNDIGKTIQAGRKQITRSQTWSVLCLQDLWRSFQWSIWVTISPAETLHGTTFWLQVMITFYLKIKLLVSFLKFDSKNLTIFRICDDSFATASELSSHILKHFMERPFGCR